MTTLGVSVLAAAVLVALGGLGAVAAIVLGVLRRSPEDAASVQVASLRAELAELRTTVKGLPNLWESERERAEVANEQAKRRMAGARAALSTARRLAEDDDDEGDESGDDDAPDDAPIRAGNARTGRREGVLPLFDDVEGDSREDLTKRALAAGWTPFI